MDEKTERLRELFVDIAGEETVTESQTEDRGSLLGDSGGDLGEVIEQLREKFGFELSLSDEPEAQEGTEEAGPGGDE